MKKILLIAVLSILGQGLFAAINTFDNKTVNISKNTATNQKVTESSAVATAPIDSISIVSGNTNVRIGVLPPGNDPGTNFPFYAIRNGSTVEIYTGKVSLLQNDSTYTFVILVGDTLGATAQATFSITVLANQRPVFANQILEIDENRPVNTIIRRITGGPLPLPSNFIKASDPDGPNASLTYAVIQSPTPNIATFSTDTNGLTARSSVSLDYEARQEYVYSIEATDIDGGKDTATITIRVKDVNEAPVITGPTGTISIQEDFSGKVTDLVWFDPDTLNLDQTIQFVIQSQTGGAPAGNPFTINPTTGAISVGNAQALDYDLLTAADKIIRVTVRISDQGFPPSLSSTFEVRIGITRVPNKAFPSSSLRNSYSGVSITNDCNKLVLVLDPTVMRAGRSIAQEKSRCANSSAGAVFGTCANVNYRIQRIQRDLTGNLWTTLTTVGPNPTAYNCTPPNGSHQPASPRIDDFGAIPGKEYAYNIRYEVGGQVCDVGNLGGLFIRNNFPGRPAEPIGISASRGNAVGAPCENIEVRWTNIANNATAIEIYREENVNFSYSGKTLVHTVSTNLSSTTVYIDQLVAANRGKTYRYTINAKNSSTPACELSTDAQTLDAYCIGLPVPSKDLVATPKNECTQVELTWIDEAVISSPKNNTVVYRREGTGAFIPLDTLVPSARVYTDLNPVRGNQSTYVLRGINQCGIGNNSNFAQIDLQGLGARPSNLTASTQVSGNEVSLRLNWNQVEEAPHRILRNGIEIGTVAANITTFLDETSDACTFYDYTVGPVNGCGLGQVALVKGQIVPPLNLTSFNATDGKFPDKIELSWNNVPFETGYRILKDNQQIFLANKDVTVYFDENSLPGELHDFSVIAINDCQQSSPLTDYGFADPSGLISGKITTPGGVNVEDVEVTVTPVFGTSIKFNGAPTNAGHGLNLTSSDAHLNLGTEAIDFATGFTFEGWFQFNSLGSGVFASFSNGNQSRLEFENEASSSAIKVTSFGCANNQCASVTTTSNGVIVPGTWLHLAVSVSATGELKIYKDGVLITQNTNAIKPFGTANKNLVGVGKTETSNFNGNIDDIRIWNTVRTAEQIFAGFDTELLGNEANLSRYAKLNALDDVNPNATPNGKLIAPSPALFNLISGAILGNSSPVVPVLDGGFVEGPTLTNTTISNNSITLSLWVKSDPGDIKNRTVFSGNLSGGEVEFTIGKGVSNVANFMSLANGNRLSASTALNDQQWHNVMYVYRRPTNSMEIWIDGVREAKGNVGAINWQNWPLAIGAKADGSFPFKGTLDDVSLWKIALDSAYIAKYYNRGMSGKEEGLIAYWKFDEGKNPLAFDRTANDFHGTLKSFPSLVNWSLNEKAPVKNMSFTDSLGNYVVEAINYGTSVNGNQFTITPYYASNGILHTFNPSTRTRTLSYTTVAHDAVDFIDQTVMPLSGYVKYPNSSCFVEYVEFMLNGQSVNPIAQTNSDGVWRLDAPLGIQKINPRSGTVLPDTITLFVERPVTALEFIDYEGYRLQGTVSGNCGVVIGNSVIRLRSDNGCYDKTFPVKADGTFLIDSIPPLLIEAQVIPDNQLIVFDSEIFFHNKDTTINFVYTTPLQAEVIIDTNQTVNDLCGNSVKLLSQGAPYFADIHVFEEYAGGNRCYLDSADLRIDDQIGDLTTVIDTSFTNNPDGIFRYTSRAGEPNLGGIGANQYKKKLEVTVIDSSGRQTVADEFILVQGQRQRASTFTTTAPDIVFYVLRDPPGDASFSYIEKSSELCRTFSIGGTRSINFEASINPKVGINITAGWVAEANFGVDVKPTVGFGAGLSFGLKYTDEVCVSLAENVSTNSSGEYVGADMDLFLGGALNYTFARLDILEYDTLNCQVDLSTAIGRNPEGIETFFQYTQKHIKESVIPSLEMLRDLPGNPTDTVAFWQKQVDGWNQTLDLNDAYKRAAAPMSNNMPIGGTTYNKNISFAYGSGYSGSESVTETQTIDLELGLAVTQSAGFEFDVDIAGNGIEGELNLTVETTLDFAFANSSSNTKDIGYELGDDDPGDFFSVNIKQDRNYGTLVFETVAGESMCPHEESTVQREKPQVLALRNTVIQPDPNQPAVFEIVISSLSESEDDGAFEILAIAENNQDGATVTINGQNLASPLGVSVPGTLGANTIKQVLSIERGPGQYRHEDIKIAVYSSCENGNGGDVVAADTVSLTAIWLEPCSDIRILNPGNDWIVDKTSNDELGVSFTGFDTSNPTGMVRFALQYRRKTGGWIQVDELLWGDLKNSAQDGSTPLFGQLKWNLSPTLSDGEYEVRVRAVCATNESFTDVINGIVSRTPPTVFGMPQPSDGVLHAGDEISVTFNENIDCNKLTVESVKLKGVLSGFEYVSKALEFNGVNQYAEIPHISAYDFGTNKDFTLEFWVKTGFNQNDPCLISNKDWSNGRNKGWAVSVYQGNRFRFNIGDGVNMANVNGPVIGDNQWHHVAIAVDRDFGIFIYKDGVLAASDSTAVKNVGDIDVNLGISFAQDGTTNYPYYWSGILDEVRLWDTYRFQLNVLQGRFRSYDFDTPNLVGLWRLDDAQGPFAFDRSSNANFGNLVNNPIWVLTGAAPISMDDIESLVDITYTCAGSKIVIEPVLDIKYLENSFFTATVMDAKDLHNNQIVQPVSWDFYVDQNPVSWENINVSYTKFKHENLVFVERLINDGPYLENYVLENVPAWLVPSKTQGSIPASFVEPISFSVDSFVNPGIYSQKLNAATTKGWEPLYLDVNVLCPPPSWAVNVASYQYSMEVTGKLIIEGDTSKDEHDMIAAMVGDEVRGVAPMIKTPRGHFFFLKVHSNVNQGENVVLKAWDASECKEYPLLDPVLSFNADTLIGGMLNPLIVQTSGVVVQEIALKSGWNWISLNVNEDTGFVAIPLNNALATLNPTTNDVIKNQTQTSLYYQTQEVWQGMLTHLNNKSMYMIKVDQPDVLRYAGYEVDLSRTIIDINPGWNYVGYPVGGNLSVNVALSSLNPSMATGDIIKSQYGYAEYIAGEGWFGSLKFLEPGLGYMLNASNQGILAYPSFKSTRNREIQNNELLHFDKKFRASIDKYKWNVNPNDYTNVHTITAKLFYTDMEEIDAERILVVAKHKDEVRGVGHAHKVHNQWYYFLTYYSTAEEEKDVITFEAFFENEQELHNIVQKMPINAVKQGTINEPYILQIAKKKEIVEDERIVENGYYLDQNNPNPFTSQTMISFGIPKEDRVTIHIYSAQGQRIATVVDREFEEGDFQIMWNPGSNSGVTLNPGIYYMTMSSGNFYATKKIIYMRNK